jgi:hypothetical protein
MLKGDETFNYEAVENGKVCRIDLARTFEIARAAGYNGYFRSSSRAKAMRSPGRKS